MRTVPPMRAGIEPGATFPDYQLADQDGKQRRLSELQGQDPMLLLLARGGYCPKEMLFHREMVAWHPQLVVGYVQIVTLSTEPVFQSAEWRRALGAHWTFLSDPERTVQQDLDIAEYTDPVRNPMIPHAVLLEPGLRIFRIYNGYWYFGRPSRDELWRDFREMGRRYRSDWDPTAPELRAAWQRGEKERFFPYKRKRGT